MNIIPLKSKIEADQFIKISTFKEVIKPTVPHKHAAYYELIALSEGAGYHVIDDHTFDVLTPCIYFLKPGQTHCWDFSRIPRGYVILFREDLLSKDSLEIVYQLSSHITLTESDAIFSLIRIAYDDYVLNNDNVKILKAYLSLLLLKISDQANAVTIKHRLFSPVYYEFKSLINENYQQLKKIQQYANLLKITPAQLNVVCKNAAGKTPSMLLNERILLEAKTLLSNTNFSIKEITGNLEFSDPSHFVKFFKLNTNLTPGQYRELALKKNSRSV